MSGTVSLKMWPRNWENWVEACRKSYVSVTEMSDLKNILTHSSRFGQLKPQQRSFKSLFDYFVVCFRFDIVRSQLTGSYYSKICKQCLEDFFTDYIYVFSLKSQEIFPIGEMAEWSKAVHSSCTLFGGVGSNPTLVKPFCPVECLAKRCFWTG